MPFTPAAPALSSRLSPLVTPTPVVWAEPAREAAFNAWLAGIAADHPLQIASLRPASADASFRRYLRVDCLTVDSADAQTHSRIIMDAPPAQENCRPFVDVARLMAQAGLNVPEVLAWDEPNGFMLLSDLGGQTMMQAMDRDHPQANHGTYMQAVDALIAWQLASKPGVLPPYDEVLLRRELELFPDWYIARHRGVKVEGDVRSTLDAAFKHIVSQNMAWPSVYVHRDFMPRNLMVDVAPTLVATRTALDVLVPEALALRAVPMCAGTSGAAALSPKGALAPWGGPSALITSSTHCGRIKPYAATTMTSARAAWMASRACRASSGYLPSSRRLRGCASGMWWPSANCLTAEVCSFMPRPPGRSGCVRTNAISWPAACRHSRATRANSGVPAKMTRRLAASLNPGPRAAPSAFFS